MDNTNVCVYGADDLQRLERLKVLQGGTGHRLQLIILEHPEGKKAEL